jgi:pSer/pThr/pTyr-binding forkhead associated (FHA) protein
MPYLKLQLISTGRTLELHDPLVQLGRDPSAAVSFRGTDARVVSTRHAELRYGDNAWRLIDLDSRNGTYVNGRRVQGQAPLAAGDEIRLGETGPRITVVAMADVVEATLIEHPMFAVATAVPDPAPAARGPEVRSYGVTLIASGSGKRFEARGTRIRIGRGKECEIRPVVEQEGIVSRVHAELTVGASGGLSLRDVGSKNGTFLNGDSIAEATPVRLGDRITLGTGGPVLVVEGIGTGPVKAAVRPPSVQGMSPTSVMGLITTHWRRPRMNAARGTWLHRVSEGRRG